MLEEGGMLSTAVVLRSQRKYPAHSAALALYPPATFVFSAMCLTTGKEDYFFVLEAKA